MRISDIEPYMQDKHKSKHMQKQRKDDKRADFKTVLDEKNRKDGIIQPTKVSDSIKLRLSMRFILLYKIL